jgi:tRNA-Thr(GGU) m(6)t(6)A37 methyltransferase TsaA
VKSTFTEIYDRDWREFVSEIHIAPHLVDGLRGLDENSHITVIFYLHKSRFDPDLDLVRRPMDREDLPMLGVFATRSNYRPNYIALTTVELLAVEGGVLKVRGLDALDGTPVLDIKPYVPHKDYVENARLPAWTKKLRDEPAAGDDKAHG